MKKYYVMVNGQQQGPYPADQIRSMNLGKDTYVFNNQLSKEWVKLGDVAELNSVGNNGTVPQPPKVTTNNQQRVTVTHSSNTSSGNSNTAYSGVKASMFSNPFSFTGRIRRMEYGISCILYIIAAVFITSLIESGAEILILAEIPLLWFIFAQSAKRCHDRGNSGWYQIIPFYGLWLLFGEGDQWSNNYGNPPK